MTLGCLCLAAVCSLAGRLITPSVMAPLVANRTCSVGLLS